MAGLYEQEPYRILIVEDEPSNIQVIAGCLSSDYQLLIAKSRQKALQLLQTHKVDLILLDVNLPDGNGFDICKQVLSEQEDLSEISIVFMTGRDSPEDEAKGLSLGANDYIHKPINCAVLQARVKLQFQLKRRTSLLSQLARIDGLTEIPNRRAFDDRLENEWRRSVREKKPLSLAILDIDYFKQFNDIYGHPAGDRCLKSVAYCLTEVFQRGSDFFARYGGEEFVVLLYDADRLSATNMLQQLLDKVSELRIPHQGSLVKDSVTFSAGICTVSPPEGNHEKFLAVADEMLYQAKQQGRAKICSQELGDMNAS